jgi:hypothetical protein
MAAIAVVVATVFVQRTAAGAQDKRNLYYMTRYSSLCAQYFSKNGIAPSSKREIIEFSKTDISVLPGFFDPLESGSIAYRRLGSDLWLFAAGHRSRREVLVRFQDGPGRYGWLIFSPSRDMDEQHEE